MLDFFKKMWKSGWKNKVTLVFAAFVFVVAAYGVLHGLTCG